VSGAFATLAKIMNKTLSHSLRGVFALLALAFAVSSASAEPTTKEKKDKPIPEKVLKKYDLNKDGMLDDTEMAAWKADRKAAAEKKHAEAKKAADGAAAATPAPAGSEAK
jgi:uncharacterized protein involved in copper resistance